MTSGCSTCTGRRDRTKLRLVRRDRPQRQLELVEIDLPTGATKTLLTETVVSANLESQAPRYVKGGGDMIWWSERAGWGHYYLYDHNGTYKRPLTSGTWRADQIAQIDTVGGVVWVSGVGREQGENPYYRHLYRVNADGTGFALVDAGDFNHAGTHLADTEIRRRQLLARERAHEVSRA